MLMRVMWVSLYLLHIKLTLKENSQDFKTSVRWGGEGGMLRFSSNVSAFWTVLLLSYYSLPLVLK